MRGAIQSKPVYPEYLYREDLNEMDDFDTAIRRAKPRPGMFRNWKEAAAVTAIWMLLVGFFTWLFLSAISFGLSMIGML